MRIDDFEYDEGNSLQIQLGHGIAPEEVEEVFAYRPFSRKTKKGHHVALGPTLEGRFITVVFELKQKGVARPII